MGYGLFYLVVWRMDYGSTLKMKLELKGKVKMKDQVIMNQNQNLK